MCSGTAAQFWVFLDTSEHIFLVFGPFLTRQPSLYTVFFVPLTTFNACRAASASSRLNLGPNYDLQVIFFGPPVVSRSIFCGSIYTLVFGGPIYDLNVDSWGFPTIYRSNLRVPQGSYRASFFAQFCGQHMICRSILVVYLRSAGQFLGSLHNLQVDPGHFGSLWDYFGIVFAPFRGRFEIILGSF